MDNKLKKVIQWTVYIMVTLAIITILASLVVNILQPTFFPNVSIDGFQNYTNNASVLLSFLSAGLGFFSIWQANLSSKQSASILSDLSVIKRNQERISGNIVSLGQHNVETAQAKSSNQWAEDTATQ